MPVTSDVSFKAFPAFNAPQNVGFAGQRMRLNRDLVEALFPGNSLAEKIVRALGEAKAMTLKECMESFEFFERVRRRMRTRVMADLCCGHGLTGLLFAAFERGVEQVYLVDRRKPASQPRLMGALLSVAPWVESKVIYLESSIAKGAAELPPGTAILGVHACGVRTDRCTEVAVQLRGPVAVMPCCYAQTAKRAPRALVRSLGAELATDVDRTYRLQAAGYQVDWSAIPKAVSDKNRILVGIPLT